ncbi:MAG: hypothetical protein HY820_06490 [Acidobacteria bacterium]|nr:hypothetical protein [Acidobacteriota bacterium]
MKRLFSTIFLTLLSTALFAGPLDGRWSFDSKAEGQKGKGKRAGKTIQTVLDLKAEGETLTGHLSANAGKRARTIDLTEGKVNGNQISFTTVQKSKNGERKLVWSGVLDGDQLKLTRKREGGKRGQEVVAKRQ